jgi:monoamine oxidase
LLLPEGAPEDIAALFTYTQSHGVHRAAARDVGTAQARDYLQIAAGPKGRVHVAGEHTSIHRASMNGALEFGVRVAGEVRKADGD